MLRSFRLANHRSFRDEHELLLMPSYDNDRAVVPVAAVFGANASGKSNLLNGLKFMSSLVVDWGAREPRSGIPRSPFRLEPKSLLEPSGFTVELVLNSIRYVYGFTVDDEQVRTEWLYTYPRGRRQLLFKRDGRTVDFGSTKVQRAKSKAIEELLTGDTLFLALAARLELHQYWPVFDWFTRSLSFIPALRVPILDGERIARFVERAPENRDMFLGLARAADVGIQDLKVEYIEDSRAIAQTAMLGAEVAALERAVVEADPEQRPELEARARRARALVQDVEYRARRPRLLLTHGKYGVSFGLDEESEGTQQWLAMLRYVIPSLSQGRTLVIDEIDTSLHPLLVRKLVELFCNSDTNSSSAQLLFTTHDAYLLAPVAGESTVRRDQVWFVDKNDDGASGLYPLTDFRPRKNEHNISRRYLGGSYGAIPFLGGFSGLRAVPSERTESQ